MIKQLVQGGISNVESVIWDRLVGDEKSFVYGGDTVVILAALCRVFDKGFGCVDSIVALSARIKDPGSPLRGLARRSVANMVSDYL